MCYLNNTIIAAIIGAIISVVGFLLIALSQNKQLKKNQFETTFFNLLSNTRDMVNSICGDFGNANNFRKGQAWFTLAAKNLDGEMKKHFQSQVMMQKLNSLNDNNEKIEFIKNEIKVVYSEFQVTDAGQLWHYFRFIYNVMKFVDSSNVPNKKFYFNFIQAQMSQNELIFWFYNGIHVNGMNFYKYTLQYDDFFQNFAIPDLYDFSFYIDNIQMYKSFYPNHKFR